MSRDEALNEISNRIKRDKNILGLKAFRWNNNDTLDKNLVPAIYMFEGEDVIKSHNERSPIGYPAKRKLEIQLEIVVKKDYQLLKDIYNKTRRAVFCDVIQENNVNVWKPNVNVSKNSFIQEIKTDGPNPYKIPELIGIRFFIGLSYTDNGIFKENSRKVI